MQNVVLYSFWLFTIIHAQSPCDRVPFIDRASWGAMAPIAITNLTRKPLSFYVIHHTYDPPK